MKITFYRSRKVVFFQILPLLALSNAPCISPTMMSSEYIVKMIILFDFIFLSLLIYRLIMIKILHISDDKLIIYKFLKKEEINSNFIKEVIINKYNFSKIKLFNGKTFALPLFDLSDVEFDKAEITLHNFLR
ncbi:hypothetical protein [Hymenobacter rubripertinctus]|uniref:hypothetical protein n=1 Tax=Hymenobacter rubripertinctus TaxID=2029981 RepID=UPI0011C43440|nr:hypothetical protein [Hymenobacter rubripertinctus]